MCPVYCMWLFIRLLSLPQDHDTALTIASYNGKTEVVKELLAAGALTYIQADVCHILWVKFVSIF